MRHAARTKNVCALRTIVSCCTRVLDDVDAPAAAHVIDMFIVIDGKFISVCLFARSARHKFKYIIYARLL